MTREYKLAYGRGYNTGSRGRWPDHRPPKPPDEIISALMQAAQKLRDGVDCELATLDSDDEWTQRLGPLIDALDEQFMRVGKWVRDETKEA